MTVTYVSARNFTDMAGILRTEILCSDGRIIMAKAKIFISTAAYNEYIQSVIDNENAEIARQQAAAQKEIEKELAWEIVYGTPNP